MTTFFTLFNIPVIIPLTFGLISKRIPRWGAFLSIIWGLIVGAMARFIAGWSMGLQVYLAAVSTFAILMLSDKIRQLYLSKRKTLYIISLLTSVLYSLIFTLNIKGEMTAIKVITLIIGSFALGFSLVYSNRFIKDDPKDKEIVENFFKKLETPVDILNEVYGKGEKEISTFPFLGTVLMLIGILIPFLSFFAGSGRDVSIFLAISSIYIVFGGLMIYFGKKAERKFNQYLEFVRSNKQK